MSKEYLSLCINGSSFFILPLYLFQRNICHHWLRTHRPCNLWTGQKGG